MKSNSTAKSTTAQQALAFFAFFSLLLGVINFWGYNKDDVSAYFYELIGENEVIDTNGLEYLQEIEYLFTLPDGFD
jgi:hypothetical protein